MNEKPKSSRWALLLEVALLALFAGFAAFSQWSKRTAQAQLLGAREGYEQARGEVTHLQEIVARQAAAEAARVGPPNGATTVPTQTPVSGKGCLLSDGSRLWLFVAYASPGVVKSLVVGVDRPAPSLFADHLEVPIDGDPALPVPYEGSLLRLITPGGLVALTTRDGADAKSAVERVAAGFFTLEATLLDLTGARSLDVVLGK